MTIFSKDSHRNNISMNSQKSKFSAFKNILDKQKNAEDDKNMLKKSKFKTNQNEDFQSNQSEISENSMDQFDRIIEYNQKQEGINIEQIEDIYDKEEEVDLSIQNAKQQKKNSSILTNPKYTQQSKSNLKDDDLNSNQSKQPQTLNLLDQIQKNEQITLPSKTNLDNKSNNKKSDLEFFLQKGHDYFYAEQMKNHIKQNSCNPQILRRDKSFNQNDTKDKSIQRSNLRSVTQNEKKIRQERQNFTYIEQNKNGVKNDHLPEQFKNKRQNKHQPITKGNDKQINGLYNNQDQDLKENNDVNDKFQQNKDNKKLSSNFQSLQIHEFNNNNQNDQNLNQKEQSMGNLLGGQTHINLPYQFDCKDRGLNMMVFSPISKESDKLLNTPFSSNQQTNTKDTTNKQKLLFSDLDYKNQDAYYRYESSDENEQQNNTQQINKNFYKNDKQLNIHQNNQFNHKKQNVPFQFEFHLNKQKSNNNLNDFNENDEKNQIFGNSQRDLNQFTKNQQDPQSQQDLFVSILEKADYNNKQSQSDNDTSNQQKSNVHKGIPESIFSKISFKEIQNEKKKQSENSIDNQHNLMKQVSENDKIESDEKQKQQNYPHESGVDLIKFETCDDFSIITDYDKSNQVQQDKNQTIPNQNTQVRFNEEGNQLFEDQQNLDDLNIKNPLQMSDESPNEKHIQQINEQILIKNNEDLKIEKQSNNSSKSSYEQQMDNDAGQLTKQSTLNKNQSVQKIMLIKEEEKKIRRAFRYLTTSSNKMEMLQTKKQFKIAEKVGVKLPYVKQLSQSRFKKQAQNLVMKKILNKKIQILVQTVMNKHNSEKLAAATNQVLTNEEQQNIKFYSQNQKNLIHFEQIMNTSQSNSQANTSKSQNEFKHYTFNQAQSRSSSESRQIPDVKNCQSEYSNNSPQNNLSLMNSQKFPSPVMQYQDPDSFQRKLSIPKSKFSNNTDHKSPNIGYGLSSYSKQSPDNNFISPSDNFGFNQNYNYNDNFQLDKGQQIQQLQPQLSIDKDEPFIKIQDIINEDENESRLDYSDDQDLLNESDDNIELQINNIYSSRLPNFQLMLYIDKMIQSHKQKYQIGQDQFELDDYQCYEEIEFNEKEKDNKDSALDNSIDIPIDIIKPNFEQDELFNLPNYLDSQISILDNKLSQIVEQTFEDCCYCLDKIKKLAKIKEKKYLFIGTKDDTDTNINQDNVSHIQTRDYVHSINQQKITISNLMNPSPLLINKQKLFQKSPLIENSAINGNKEGEQVQDDQPAQEQISQVNSGRVNLGHNIQFAMFNEKASPQKDEYNFFTELERKNQILLQRNSSFMTDPQNDQSVIPNIKSFCNSPGSRNKKQSNQFNEEEQKEQAYVNKFSDALEKSKIPKDQTKKSKFGELKVGSKDNNNTPPMSEQQKIKNEFQKMFKNMRTHLGDRSPINMDMDSDFSSVNFN